MRNLPPHRTRALRAVVLGVTAWVAVVALGSTLVWAVISRAGEGVVGSTNTAAGSAGDSRTSTPGPRRVGSPAVRKPSVSPTGASQSPTSGADDSSSPSAPSSTRPSSPGTSGDDHPSSSTSHHTSAPPATPTQQRTWSGKAGSVTASCTGTKIHYGSALPQSGYRLAEWEYEGPSELKVKFEATGESEAETEVTGVCRNGAPQFRTESKGSGDD